MVIVSPLTKRRPGDREALVLVIDAQRAGAGDAGLAHAARHDGGVRGHAAARGENAFRGVHAVDVFRARLDAHENDLAARGGERLGLFRIEDDLADGRAGRGRQAGGENVAASRQDRSSDAAIDRATAARRAGSPPRA